MTVRVGASEAEAKLMLALRVEGCSALGHVTRVPLTQPMAMLHYTASLNVRVDDGSCAINERRVPYNITTHARGVRYVHTHYSASQAALNENYLLINK